MRVRLNFVLQHAVMKDKQRQLQTVGYAYLVKNRPHLGCGSTPPSLAIRTAFFNYLGISPPEYRRSLSPKQRSRNRRKRRHKSINISSRRALNALAL